MGEWWKLPIVKPWSQGRSPGIIIIIIISNKNDNLYFTRAIQLLSKARLRPFIFEEACARAEVFACSSRHSKFGLGSLTRKPLAPNWLRPWRKAFLEWRCWLSPWFYCLSGSRTALEGRPQEHDINQHLLSTSSGEGWSCINILLCPCYIQPWGWTTASYPNFSGEGAESQKARWLVQGHRAGKWSFLDTNTA